MIVKAISHKRATKSAIRELIRYVFNKQKMQDHSLERKPLIIKQLIPSYDKDKWTNFFYANDKNRTFEHAKRTVLRHEIISFSPDSNKHLTREKLKVLGKWYLKHRCPESMAVATVHYDTNPHIHFIIAGVSIDGSSTRISRADFKAFKLSLQNFQELKYPELSASVVDHSKKKRLALTLTSAEEQMKRSRGVFSEKQKLAQQVMAIAKECRSLGELAKRLTSYHLEPYYRGNVLTGVWLGNRKFRLSTLGVGKQHLLEMTLEQERLDSLSKRKPNIDIDYDLDI